MKTNNQPNDVQDAQGTHGNADNRTHKQAIVLRTDLNMRKGKMVAQGAHASMGALLSQGKKQMVDGRPCLVIPLDDQRIAPWLNGRFAKIGLGVDSEEGLRALHEKAQSLGMISSLILDSGLTEFGGVPTYTAVGIGPDCKEAFNELTDSLKLL